MSIKLNGIISGFDTETLISSLMELERVRVYRQEERQEQLEAKKKAWQQVRSGLTSIQTKLDQLRFPTLFRSRKVELSDSSVATVSVDSGAAQSSYTLRVVKLAQSHMITTGDEALYKAADEQLGWAGTFEIGTKDGALATITVEATDTLSSLAAKINEANSGVMANVVMIREGKFRLILSASQSGADNEIRLANEVAQPPDGEPYEKGFLDGILGLTGSSRLELSAAQDAEIEVNGHSYTSSTNNFENVLPGIKITAKKLTGSDPVSMIVSADTDKVVQAVKDWVNAVNSLQDQLKNLTAYDAEKKTSSVLTGDSLVRSIQYYLREPFSAKVLGMPESMNMLSQIGVSTGAYGSANYGKIVVDEAKLREAVQRDPEGVARLFGLNEEAVTNEAGVVTEPAHKGIAVQMNEYLKSLLDSDGAIGTREESLSKQIDRIKETIERIELQLEQREKVLQQQFTRMEEVLSKLQSQNNYLTAMIKSLSSSDKS